MSQTMGMLRQGTWTRGEVPLRTDLGWMLRVRQESAVTPELSETEAEKEQYPSILKTPAMQPSMLPLSCGGRFRQFQVYWALPFRAAKVILILSPTEQVRELLSTTNSFCPALLTFSSFPVAEIELATRNTMSLDPDAAWLWNLTLATKEPSLSGVPSMVPSAQAVRKGGRLEKEN